MQPIYLGTPSESSNKAMASAVNLYASMKDVPRPTTRSKVVSIDNDIYLVRITLAEDKAQDAVRLLFVMSKVGGAVAGGHAELEQFTYRDNGGTAGGEARVRFPYWKSEGGVRASGRPIQHAYGSGNARAGGGQLFSIKSSGGGVASGKTDSAMLFTAFGGIRGGGGHPQTIKGSGGARSAGRNIPVIISGKGAARGGSPPPIEVNIVFDNLNGEPLIYGDELGSVLSASTDPEITGTFEFTPLLTDVWSPPGELIVEAVFTAIDPNYMPVTKKSITIQVIKRPATFTITGLTHVYDNALKQVTVVVGNLVNGKTVIPNHFYSGGPPVNTGTYPFSVDVFASQWYSGSTSGTMFITPATLMYSVLPITTHTYDATPKGVPVVTIPGGVPFSTTYIPAQDLSQLSPVKAGMYSVVLASANSNYVGGLTVQMEIKKATPVLHDMRIGPSFTRTYPVVNDIYTMQPNFPNYFAKIGDSGIVSILGAELSSAQTIFTSSDPFAISVSGDRLLSVAPGRTFITSSNPGDANCNPSVPDQHQTYLLAKYTTSESVVVSANGFLQQIISLSVVFSDPTVGGAFCFSLADISSVQGAGGPVEYYSSNEAVFKVTNKSTGKGEVIGVGFFTVAAMQLGGVFNGDVYLESDIVETELLEAKKVPLTIVFTDEVDLLGVKTVTRSYTSYPQYPAYKTMRNAVEYVGITRTETPTPQTVVGSYPCTVTITDPRAEGVGSVQLVIKKAATVIVWKPPTSWTWSPTQKVPPEVFTAYLTTLDGKAVASGTEKYTQALASAPELAGTLYPDSIYIPNSLTLCVTITPADTNSFESPAKKCANVTINKAKQSLLTVTTSKTNLSCNELASINTSGGSGTGAMSYALAENYSGAFVYVPTGQIKAVGTGNAKATAQKEGDSCYLPTGYVHANAPVYGTRCLTIALVSCVWGISARYKVTGFVYPYFTVTFQGQVSGYQVQVWNDTLANIGFVVTKISGATKYCLDAYVVMQERNSAGGSVVATTYYRMTNPLPCQLPDASDCTTFDPTVIPVIGGTVVPTVVVPGCTAAWRIISEAGCGIVSVCGIAHNPYDVWYPCRDLSTGTEFYPDWSYGVNYLSPVNNAPVYRFSEGPIYYSGAVVSSDSNNFVFTCAFCSTYVTDVPSNHSLTDINIIFGSAFSSGQLGYWGYNSDHIHIIDMYIYSCELNTSIYSLIRNNLPEGLLND